MKKFFILLFAGVFLLAGQTLAQSRTDVLGKWTTIDDDTNKPKSVVEIYEENGKVYGRILKLFREPHEEQDPVCNECDEDDPRYKQRVIGMQIITDMEWDEDDGEWEDGEIMDPANGKSYDCEIWKDQDTGNLRVRGYLYFLYRTQTWEPYTGE